ncbi:hypothetical protein ABPG77_002894 [Micractinium sp. CCAP 211/92]
MWATPPPRGNKTCSLDCNKVGTCNALTGYCTCPAGWTGFNCLHPMKRHCTHTYTEWGFERFPQPANLSLGLERESMWAFPATHCAGFCDDTLAACFCPSNTTFGHIPAPPDAPLDSRPVRMGRPMDQFCQPNRLPDGRPTNWGTVEPEDLFGPEGWCNAEQPRHECPCYIDGWGGKNCMERYEQYCPNQCNGRGECELGYCHCDPGWHGIDCAHRSATADASAPGREATQRWVAEHVHTPAAREFEAGSVRKRPLIYVYELPSQYNVLMHQWRHTVGMCVPRHFAPDNVTVLTAWTYALESGFLEMLLQSEHRTLDPEEADYFYVPTFTSCFINPVRDTADSLYDFFYAVHFNRVQGATNMLLEAYHWIRAHHPYWDRRGGRDHIWLVTHDEAPCYVPAAIRPSIIISHWGRMDANHTSGTGYMADSYDADIRHPQFEPEGWRRKIEGFPCYDPAKDLVVPALKTPEHFGASPLAGAATRERTWLGFHRGRVQPENMQFARGIRQRLAKLAEEQGWAKRHRILVGEEKEVEGDYSSLLASSVFCLVLPGDGWTARMEDAMLHGCIPVIIMDEVHVAFESALDLASVSLRIPQSDMHRLPEILQAVPEELRQQMRHNLARVWQRYAYTSWRPYARAFRQIQQKHASVRGAPDQGAEGPATALLPATVPDLNPSADDAFVTIMAWLYGRIPATR